MATNDTAAPSLLVLRIWLPDRPGALGAVASRIGAVGADLVGIEIVDRGAGRVVDELSVALPDPDLVDLLVSEIHDVEGTDVEDTRWLNGAAQDPVVSALELASTLADVGGGAELAGGLAEGAVLLLHADWAVLVDTASEEALGVACGPGHESPSASWVCNFLRGVGESTLQDPSSLHDLAFSALGTTSLVLVVSRERVPLRGRERSVLGRLCALGASHPSLGSLTR